LTALVTPIGIDEPRPELKDIQPSFNGYGLGFGLRDYRGHKLVTHTGGLPGYVSRVAMIPDLRLGVAILTNQESGAAFDSVANFVLDFYLGAPPRDWIAALKALEDSERSGAAAGDRKTAGDRDARSGPSLPLPRYAGSYRDAWYGDVTISQSNGALTIRFDHTPALSGMLEHWQHDTFVARWNDRELRADAFITFALQPDGSIESARMQAVSPETDFSFDFQDLLLRPARRPDPRH
jgi:hypothetical protein